MTTAQLCFEQLVKAPITSTLQDTLDPLQENRTTDAAITFTLHTTLSHLEQRNTYVRMLFIVYCSAFNTPHPPPPNGDQGSRF